MKSTFQKWFVDSNLTSEDGQLASKINKSYRKNGIEKN